MKLILFFNGWGVPKSIFNRLNKDIKNNEYQIKIIELGESIFDLDINFNNYSEINIIAWSFGVFNASTQLSNFDIYDKISHKINKKIAINGTIKSIDKKYGISPIIFKNTLENMNFDNYLGFLKNTGLDSNLIKDLDITIENNNLKNYINILDDFGKNYDNKKNNNFSFIFDNLITSEGDKIFTPRNQMRFSKDNDINHKIIGGEHYCFEKWSNWGEILDEF